MIGTLLKQLIPQQMKRTVKRALLNSWDSTRYGYSKGDLDSGNKHHVIFVCKGNICRSAFAEYYLRSVIAEGTHKIESCGLDVDQGLFSPPEAVSVAKEFKVDLELHQSKGVASCDVHNADLILPMEFQQYLRLKSMYPSKQSKIRLLRDFAPWPDRLLCNINDPYGSDEDEFRRCFKRLQRSLDRLKSHLAISESM